MRQLVSALFFLSSLFLLFTFFSIYPPSLSLSFLFPPPNAGSYKLIFILAGQSNMAGRGGVANGVWDHFVPPPANLDPSILRLSSRLYWETAREPLHYDIDTNKTCGVGPGLVFARAILERFRSSSPGESVIGLVPCAVGGTKIERWAKGSDLYESMIKRAKESLEKRRGGGRIGAVLWFQGETDTINLEDAEVYGKRLESLIHNLRADLGFPALPVIQVALASGEGNYTEIVRKAQKGIQIPNVRMVDAYGLPLQDDQLHLTTQAQVQLGQILAQSYLSLLSQLNSTKPNSPN